MSQFFSKLLLPDLLDPARTTEPLPSTGTLGALAPVAKGVQAAHGGRFPVRDLSMQFDITEVRLYVCVCVCMCVCVCV